MRCLLSLFYLLYLILFSAPASAKSRPDAAAPPQSRHRAIANVVVLAITAYQPAAPSLQRSGLTALDAQLAALQVYELEQAFPARSHRLQKSHARENLENIFYAHYRGGRPPEEVAAELAQNPAVEFAEAKYYARLDAQPNDPLFSQQYALRKTFLPQAWERCKGEQGSVVIAIIDGGTDINHPDLQANLWHNPDEIANNGIDDDHNGLVDDIHGWNYANNSNNPASLFYGTYFSPHGTHTAGIACAVTNNGLGIAGASWNARVMAVNVGSQTDDREINSLFADRAMVYAVDQGADIISCSFSGSFSNASKRVVNYALQRGVAVIAAAGNGPGNADDNFPAAYRGVISVANTDSTDVKYYGSNYGISVDVTAPGVAILSTVENGRYEAAGWNGTSMSTPLVAGIAALVKTCHPEWNGVQAAEQVRVTADNIDLLNRNYIGQLGRGRVNAWRALSESSPSIRIKEFACQDENNDGIIQAGEKIKLSITLTNHLAPATGVSLTLASGSYYVDLRAASASLAALAANQTITLENVFEFQVRASAPKGASLPFTLTISSGAYQDSDYFDISVHPQFVNLDINRLHTTIPNNGRIGYWDVDAANAGIGFLYDNGPSLLFEGALIMGSSPATIINSARSLRRWDNTFIHDADLVATPDGDVRLFTPGTRADQESFVRFDDSGSGATPTLRITQETFARSESPFENIVLLRYQIENLTQTGKDNFHFGLFFDWDIDDMHFDTNMAGFDASRNLGYAHDGGNGPDTYVGVRVLSGLPVSYRAIWNDEAVPQNTTWGLYDGFSDAEKWEAISGGQAYPGAGPGDISNVIAAGPMTIPAGNFVEVVFALLAADDLAALQTAADHAELLRQQIFVSVVADAAPQQPITFWLGQNYPNPFNAGTTIPFRVQHESDVQLRLHDLQGRIIRRLVTARLKPGAHAAHWDGTDDDGRMLSSGSYFYQLQAEGATLVRRLVILK